MLVQSRRNEKGPKHIFCKLLKGLCYAPRFIVTNKLGSYSAAKCEILPCAGHRQSRHLNNRREIPHQPTRPRERHVQRFNSAEHAQQFLATHTSIHNYFQLRRHRFCSSKYRAERDHAFSTWRDAKENALLG
jgi:putative transposase